MSQKEPLSPHQTAEGSASSTPSASRSRDGGDGQRLAFTCGCSNVHITGTLSSEGSGQVGEAAQLEDLWLVAGSEIAKHPVYVGYDAPDDNRARAAAQDSAFDTDAEEVWRICWLCETKLYRVKGKGKGDPAVEEEVVAFDSKSVIMTDPSPKERRGSSSALPFSKLDLPISSSSHFGRPPHETPPAIYPPVSASLAGPSSSRRPTYLPRIPDPFFLPPPFIPSHPHLRDLCAGAVDYLNARHRVTEDEVRHFIDIKSREMRELQETVRAEVELMWDKYAQGPGMEEVRERERRRSASISGSTERKAVRRDRDRSRSGNQPKFSPAAEQPTENPILREAARYAAQNGTSLLSASISQNQYTPQPASVPDTVDNSIEEVARAVDKKGDQRAVAMSYVFSSLDGAMAAAGRSAILDDTVDEAETDPRGNERDRELEVVRSPGAIGTGQTGEASEQRTPRARTVKELSSPQKERKGSLLAEGTKGSKEKGKGKVSFAETNTAAKEAEGTGADTAKVDEDDDYVFDFELEDREPVKAAPHAPADAPAPSAEAKRLRNTVEQTLASTYASHAPSHRAAYLRNQSSRPALYATLRRRDSGDELDSDSVSLGDEAAISRLATSVPVAIALPGRTKSTVLYPFERKTSLSDREGMLVPPLIKAMRQRGVIPDGNSLGLSSPLPKPKSEQAGAGPGEEDEVGTLKDNRFVPPHVLARKASMQSKDVGWRSMVPE